MKKLFTKLFLFTSLFSMAQKTILINNVQIFNGTDEKTILGNILIENDKISKISASPIPTNKSAETKIIDGKGKFLMPGLIDAHWHTVGTGSGMADMMNAEIGLIYAEAIGEGNKTILRGFTSVRDMGGPTFGIKKAFDKDIVTGPRIFPSGAAISQTGGHGDFGYSYERPVVFGGKLSRAEEVGMFIIANGPDQVRTAVREQMRNGASQIKVMAGGGVSSLYDPLDAKQFSPEELKAAVDEAANWNTYVTVHIYNAAGIIEALNAGVKCIEHGQLANEEAVKLVKEKGAWLSIQAFEVKDHKYPDADRSAKNKAVSDGADAVFKLAKKYGVKVAFGTDFLFEPEMNYKQNEMLIRLNKYYSNFEILKMATSQNAELCEMSGERNPYKEAKLGVIKEGAWADMILVDGNVLKDISLIANPEKIFLLIIKSGKIHKNIL
ncbi:amidohydrolase family protein [Flavobacterium sp. 5]|uniref:metal-dependent hydrolase family protein n=1 Tax=Flavobacterium sp. 5 TaxID=2035199 RepID=UPI000C2B92BF|nr:amidohydrolase family protein [Flavobacterium sp. 5]